MKLGRLPSILLMTLIMTINTLHAGVVDSVLSDTLITVGNISLSGNKITKDRIIFRELEFSTGSAYEKHILDSLIVKSRQNLINRSLFNFVTITENLTDDTVNIKVSVIERWYIWPIPILQFADRNINAWLDKGDLSRLNFGVDLRVENFRGLMEELKIILQFGYDIVAGVRWKIPYLNKNQILGMEVDAGVKLNHTVAYKTNANKEIFYQSPSGYAQQNIYASTSLTFRPAFNYLHSFKLGFEKFSFQDTLFVLNPDFGNMVSDYTYFFANYSFRLDFRDYKPYPLKGFYFDAMVSKIGFGIFDNDIDRTTVSMTFDQYFNIYKRFFFGYSFAGQIGNTAPRMPYFLKAGLGYYPYEIRGYELYVVDGQQLGTLRSNIKYELLPRTKFKINWIKSPKFGESFIAIYANIFFDAAYVRDIYATPQNPLANQALYGTGIGLDFITYYDLVLRLEGSYNKQKELGFFISFVAPI